MLKKLLASVLVTGYATAIAAVPPPDLRQSVETDQALTCAAVLQTTGRVLFVSPLRPEAERSKDLVLMYLLRQVWVDKSIALGAASGNVDQLVTERVSSAPTKEQYSHCSKTALERYRLMPDTEKEKLHEAAASSLGTYLDWAEKQHKLQTKGP